MAYLAKQPTLFLTYVCRLPSKVVHNFPDTYIHGLPSKVAYFFILRVVTYLAKQCTIFNTYMAYLSKQPTYKFFNLRGCLPSKVVHKILKYLYGLPRKVAYIFALLRLQPTVKINLHFQYTYSLPSKVAYTLKKTHFYCLSKSRA